MAQSKRKFSFPIWGWFFVFFGVIFTANFFMVYWAKGSFTGLVTEQPYEKGLAYNQTLAEMEAQKALGWISVFNLTSAGESHTASLTLLGKNRQPIQDATVTVLAFRPIKTGMDQEVTLKHMGGGLYMAKIELPAKGQWDFKITAIQGDNTYKVEQRKVIQ